VATSTKATPKSCMIYSAIERLLPYLAVFEKMGMTPAKKQGKT